MTLANHQIAELFPSLLTWVILEIEVVGVYLVKFLFLLLIERHVVSGHGLLESIKVGLVLYLNKHSQFACPHVICKVLKVAHQTAEFALGLGVDALESIVPDLLTLVDLLTAPLAYYLHKLALVELVSTKNQFVIGQLILASSIVAPESNLLHVLEFQLVQVLQRLNWTLAWCLEVLSTLAGLPGLYTRMTEVRLTRSAFSSLNNDVLTEIAAEIQLEMWLGEHRLTL